MNFLKKVASTLFNGAKAVGAGLWYGTVNTVVDVAQTAKRHPGKALGAVGAFAAVLATPHMGTHGMVADAMRLVLYPIEAAVGLGVSYAMVKNTANGAIKSFKESQRIADIVAEEAYDSFRKTESSPNGTQYKYDSTSHRLAHTLGLTNKFEAADEDFTYDDEGYSSSEDEYDDEEQLESDGNVMDFLLDQAKSVIFSRNNEGKEVAHDVVPCDYMKPTSNTRSNFQYK